MKTAPSPANAASDTDSTPATARNSPLPGAALSAPSGHSGGEESNSEKLLRSEDTRARAREHAGTHTPHPQLQLAVRRHPTQMANGTGAARQGGQDDRSSRSHPAPTEGFWEGLFRQSRRDQSRHSTDLGAVPLSSPPTPPPPAISPARVFQLGATTLQGTGAFRELTVRVRTSHPESTRFPAGREN